MDFEFNPDFPYTYNVHEKVGKGVLATTCDTCFQINMPIYTVRPMKTTNS
jgi:hypothetical protein